MNAYMVQLYKVTTTSNQPKYMKKFFKKYQKNCKTDINYRKTCLTGTYKNRTKVNQPVITLYYIFAVLFLVCAVFPN